MKRLIRLGAVVLLVLFAAAQDAFAAPIQRTVLQNGLVLLLSEEHSLPFITIQVVIKAGSKDDPEGREGVANLASVSLPLGAGGRTVGEINEELDFMGAYLVTNAGRDYSTAGLRVLKKEFRRAFPIFMDVLTKPTLPESEMMKERSRILAAIQASEDRPGYVAEKAFRKALYGSGPYAHPVEGTKESVSRLSRGMVKEFYDAHYQPGSCIMTIVGDFDEKLIKEYVVPALERWSGKPVPTPKKQTKFAERQKLVKIDRPITQSNVIIGHGGISRDNPDYYAVTVMNYILGGGGLTSRLAENIRSKRGLAYSIGSVFRAGKLSGSFQIVLQTKNASTDEAIEAATGEVKRIRTEPVSDKELEDTRKYLIGSFPQMLSTQSRIASFWGQVEYFGLGLDYPERYPSIIKSITKEDVLRVSQTYLDPDNYIIVVVANLKEAGLK